LRCARELVLDPLHGSLYDRGDVLGYLFIIVATLVFLWMVLSMVDEGTMPLTCPACYWGGDEDTLGQHLAWFVEIGRGRAECRWCGRRFKNSPNATLVEDRDP
jgi:hypothetical protein